MARLHQCRRSRQQRHGGLQFGDLHINTPSFTAIPYSSTINSHESDSVSLANPGDPNLLNWNITGLPTD